MSNIDIERIGNEISKIPMEMVMRDQLPESIREPAGLNKSRAHSQRKKYSCYIMVNLHPTDGTHWFIAM